MLPYWTFLWVLAGLYEIIVCYSSSKYTWPLWAHNSLAEIKRNNTGLKLGCSSTGGDVHASLNYSGVQFIGTANSYVDFSVENASAVPMNDYAIALFAKSSTPGGGTLFHYKATKSEPNKIKDIILWYNQTSLVVETFGPAGENYGKGFAALVGSTGQWVGFGITCDISKPELRLVSSGGIDERVTTGDIAYQLGQPGVLRIGASHDKTRPGYVGNLICANMYNNKITRDDFGSVESECNPNSWPATVKSGTNQPQTCDYLKGYFEMRQNNAKVQSSFSVLDNMTTPSRVKCGDFCLRTGLCKSFTFDKNTGMCKLYDSDYTSNVVSSIDTAYYMRRDVCC